MTFHRPIGILLVLATLAALAPVPTAAAGTCTATTAAPCSFTCHAGEPIAVSATGTGVVAGACSGAVAECAVQSGTCALVGPTPALGSGRGECVFVGEGSGTCSASSDPRNAAPGCESSSLPAMGTLTVMNPLTGKAIAYVDDRNYADNGLWVYLETNDAPGLQRGGSSILVPDDTDACNDGHAPPDALVF